MNELQTIENIKQCIATGKTKRAVDDLIQLTHFVCKDLNDPALMLKNRMVTLEREIVEGVVSHADQKMEEARITRALLVLVSNIEDECLPQLLEVQKAENQKAEAQQKEAERLKEEAHSREIRRFKEAERLKEDAHKRELERQKEELQFKKEEKRLENDSTVEPKGGIKWILLFFAIGIIVFSLFYFRTKEPLKPLPEPVKMTTLSGQVQFPDKKIVPLALVELTYLDTTFKAAADNNGRFNIQIPEKNLGKTMDLTIKYKGKAVVNGNINVTEANVKSLKIPFE